MSSDAPAPRVIQKLSADIVNRIAAGEIIQVRFFELIFS